MTKLNAKNMNINYNLNKQKNVMVCIWVFFTFDSLTNTFITHYEQFK